MEHLPWIGPRRTDLWWMTWKMDPTVSDDCMNPDLLFWTPSWAFKGSSGIWHRHTAGIFMHQAMTRISTAIIFRGLLLASTIPNISVVLSCWNPDETLKGSQQEMQILKYTLYRLSDETQQNTFFIFRYILHLFLPLKGHMLYIYKKHSHLRKHSFPCLCQTQPPPCSRPNFFKTSFYIHPLILLWNLFHSEIISS